MLIGRQEKVGEQARDCNEIKLIVQSPNGNIIRIPYAVTEDLDIKLNGLKQIFRVDRLK